MNDPEGQTNEKGDYSMNKNDLINEIIAGLIAIFSKEQLDMIKAMFLVKMQNYEIKEICTELSTEVHDNDYVLKRFAVDQIAKGLKQSTINAYLGGIKRFLNDTGLNYKAVTSQDIINYMAILKVKPNQSGKANSQTYISGVNKILFIFFEWAYRKHFIDEDIMRDVDRIKAKQKRKERISNEEIEACREEIKTIREAALFELMISTGLRVGEICNLKIEDMELYNRVIHIREGKSESAEREVYPSIKARNALQKYIGNRWHGYVFQQDRAGEERALTTGTVNKWAKEIGARAGCHCKTTVHVFRKTFASNEFERTNDVKYVSILLGHSSTAVTEKYYLVDDMKKIKYKALAI